MSRPTDRVFFINPPLVKVAEFYQHLLKGIGGYEGLGNRVVGKIRVAHAFRQVDVVRELSTILMNVPVKEYQLIGQYYLAWCNCRESKFNNVVLEKIIEQTRTYTTKALLSRAAIEGYQGKTEPELYFYNEALKTTSTVSDYIEASRCIAIVKAKEGFHNSALRDLESLLPFIRHVEPLVYYDFLNSYAVELGEVGRIGEAYRISHLAVSSPFTPYYPEWQDTHSDLKLKQKKSSSVTVSCLPKQQPKPRQSRPKDNVIKFPAAGKLPDPLPDEDKFSMPLSPIQALGLILKAVLGDRITDDEVEKICDNYYRVIMEWYS